MVLKDRSLEVATLLAVGWIVLSAAPATAFDSPWYVEAAFGQADSEASLGSRHPKRIDDSNGATTVALGYTLSRYLDLQAAYHDLGSHHGGFGSPCRQTDDSCIERLASLGLCVEGTDCTLVLVDLDADFSGYSFAAVPRWPVSKRFSLRGKVGVMAWDGEITSSGLGPVESFTGEDLLVGVGVEYGFPNGLGVSLSHDELDLDASTTSVGVSWRF